MKVLRVAFTKVKGNIALAMIMLASAFALAYMLTGEIRQLAFLLAGMVGVLLVGITRDILILIDRPYKFNRSATYASPLLVLGSMGLIFLNIGFDFPPYVMVITSLLAGYQLGWFSLIYNSFLRAMQTDTNTTVLDVMKDAHQTLQTLGAHSDFCDIHPTGLTIKRERYCSCGLEHSIRSLREAIKVVSKP